MELQLVTREALLQRPACRETAVSRYRTAALKLPVAAAILPGGRRQVPYPGRRRCRSAGLAGGRRQRLAPGVHAATSQPAVSARCSAAMVLMSCDGVQRTGRIVQLALVRQRQLSPSSASSARSDVEKRLPRSAGGAISSHFTPAAAGTWRRWRLQQRKSMARSSLPGAASSQDHRRRPQASRQAVRSASSPRCTAWGHTPAPSHIHASSPAARVRHLTSATSEDPAATGISSSAVR